MAEQQEERQITVEEAEKLIPANVPQHVRQELLAEVALSNEIQTYLREIVARGENGELLPSYEEVHEKINEIARAHGSEYGMAMPSLSNVNRPIVTASRTPLHHYMRFNEYRTWLEEDAAKLIGRAKIRNSWSQLGDRQIVVVNTEEGPYAYYEYEAGIRLRKLLDETILRSGTTQSAETELRAMDSLKQRINKNQWDSYVLNGVFPELSKRSDLHYFFRKGRPTLATSYHGKGNESGKVLAALCLHPMGYYSGSHVGVMTPTDEVICHLLMMRGDEHKYWAKCGQWKAWDSRSGI